MSSLFLQGKLWPPFRSNEADKCRLTGPLYPQLPAPSNPSRGVLDPTGKRHRRNSSSRVSPPPLLQVREQY
jgi:hypothetical protein